MAYIKFYGGYYKGETLFGVPDGEGSAYYDNGNYYCGEWSSGKYWGKGKCVNNDGSGIRASFIITICTATAHFIVPMGIVMKGVFNTIAL